MVLSYGAHKKIPLVRRKITFLRDERHRILCDFILHFSAQRLNFLLDLWGKKILTLIKATELQEIESQYGPAAGF